MFKQMVLRQMWNTVYFYSQSNVGNGVNKWHSIYCSTIKQFKRCSTRRSQLKLCSFTFWQTVRLHSYLPLSLDTLRALRRRLLLPLLSPCRGMWRADQPRKMLIFTHELRTNWLERITRPYCSSSEAWCLGNHTSVRLCSEVANQQHVLDQQFMTV